MASQINYDLTVTALAETSTGSGIYKATCTPTAGVEAERPTDIPLDDTNGIQIFFTGLPPTYLLKLGTRLLVGIDSPIT